MKTLILIALTATLSAQDLGVLTPLNGIRLESCHRRTDFAIFRIELMTHVEPLVLMTVIKTNDILVLTDLEDFPSGPATIEIRSICKDGQESPVLSRRINIQREGPTVPKAEMVSLLTLTTNPPSLIQTLYKNSTADPIMPPMPPEVGLVVTNGVWGPGPMPKARNESYSEGTRMRMFYSEPRK